MQQKEVLIIVGVVIAGFLLLQGGFLSGRATSVENTIYSYPQETGD